MPPTRRSPHAASPASTSSNPARASLKRLGLDYIDLYQFHGPDPYTPVEESLRAADDLIRAGKIRYLGCSNFYGWQIAKTNGIAALKNYEPLVSAQHLYNLVRRDIEREILPACDDQGLAMICWSPLAAGMLSGKYRDQDKPDAQSRIGLQAAITLPRYWFEDSLKLIDLVVELAKALDRTPEPGGARLAVRATAALPPPSSAPAALNRSRKTSSPATSTCPPTSASSSPTPCR